MILETAKAHFDEDIERACEIRDHADGLPESRLKGDLLRSAWMISVGGADAFYCDAYADLVSRTLRAKTHQSSGHLPDRLGGLRVPIVAVLNTANSWQWRMAARELIEKESVLSIKEIKSLLNLFCRANHKLLTKDTIEPWVLHADARQRHFGTLRAAYNATTGSGRNKAKETALEKFGKRIQVLFQRRHDCIHNCDRPKLAIQPITIDATSKTIEDITFLVGRSTEHLRGEYPQYLEARGFNGVTRNRVGA